ncbi:AAA family ATPase [Microbacter margulisiae]|uniref:Putative ATPase n=1 Tax=Microbacter margulisiae TaxID=1350067 RepID=A0A7W5DRN4_9PORP|nr:AAA family ATPase [Microbacter margulisiae]MBB3187681.1 putative ATPase [Microbacter margulisiae]
MKNYTLPNYHIKKIEIHNFWGLHNVIWDNLHPDVNILVGINGSGKSTLLNIVNSVFSLDKNALKKMGIETVSIECDDFSITYENNSITNTSSVQRLFTTINTFDIPVNKNKLKQDESPLTIELKQLILQTGGHSFNDYRLMATTSSSKAKEITERIKRFFSLIDTLFNYTGKQIEIDDKNNIVFKSDTGTIYLEQLSSGEKQLLLILFKVFLMDNRPYVLLMDEPEISLHISWQQDLIKILRELNPNCQLIIATHSPSLFGKGWGDKITFMEQLFQK